MDFISKLRQKAASIISPSINQMMQKAIFQWLGSDVGIVYPDNQTSYIDNGYNKNLFVYMCVNYITRNASAIPWVLKKELKDGSYQTITEHSLYDVIARPNGLYSWQEYKQQSLGYLLLTGNAMSYTVKTGLNGNKVKEVYYLPSDYIEITASGTWTNPIKNYAFSLYNGLNFKSEEVLHTKLPNYNWANGESLYGQSPLKAGLSTLEKSNATIAAMKSQAANQGAKGLLMFDSANGTSTITEPQMRSFENSVKQKINNNDKVGTIQATSKMFKYQQLGAASKDLQLIESHNVSRQDICALFGLDSMLFNDHQASSYNNMSEAKKSAYVDAILPYDKMLMEDWNNSIVRAYDENLAFHQDTSNIDVLQADKAKQADWLSKAYWISTQRKQEIMGEKADETLPKFLLPTSLVPSDEIDINNAFNDYEQSQV